MQRFLFCFLIIGIASQNYSYGESSRVRPATDLGALSLEQFQLHRQYMDKSKSEGWTFNFDVTQAKKYSTGYTPSTRASYATAKSLGAGVQLRSIDLADFGRALNPVMDQGQCGSCVYHSIMANIMDLFLVRDESVPLLSVQYLMSCGSGGGQCSGAFGEDIAKDAVSLGDFHTESDYPYTATTSRCQTSNGKKYGPIISFTTLDGSDRSLLAALHEGKGVSVGIAATSTMMSYTSGVYNACDGKTVNHYVYLQGINCGTAVDIEGNCIFDSKGNLSAKSGAWVTVRNSWGKDWGEDGYIRMNLYNRRGGRCSQLASGAGNAQILDNGLPLPE